MKKILIGAVALTLLCTGTSFAQTYRTETREQRQQERIYKGAARGHLTPRELRNLERQQHRIDRNQARAARDGYITPKERRRLERQQDRASRNIHRKQTNGRGYY